MKNAEPKLCFLCDSLPLVAFLTTIALATVVAKWGAVKNSSMALNQQSRFYRWVIRPIVNQLKQGTSPEKLSWSISLGITLGIFPIMGSTTIVCLIFGHLFKLNQPILHLFKTFTYPLQLALILVYIRLGQMLNGVPLIKFSIPQLLTRFKDDPTQFASDFGMAALHGIEAWAISAIFLIPAIYFISLPILKKLLEKIARSAVTRADRQKA